MQAIVDINGKQYPIEEGRYVRIDHYAADVDAAVTLDKVCMIVAGEQSLIGAPYVEGAMVKATVKRHGRGPKVLVYKMRCKKGYRRKNGHRQDFTELQVHALEFPGKQVS
jgi:large subunit ribosomal protein L21